MPHEPTSDPSAAPPVAVLLAAGRGRRLRSDEGGDLTPSQRSFAGRGLKAWMPLDVAGATRPLLSLSFDALHAAGVRRACVVVRPDLDRDARDLLRHERLAVDTVVQEHPRGTADAVLAAAAATGDGDFLVLNGDTWYPPSFLRALVELGGPGLAALDGHAVARDPRSNLTAEGMARWAEVTVNGEGLLDHVLPAPGRPPERDWWVSVNAWRLPAALHDFCRDLEPAPNGELELPRAVERSRRGAGLGYRVLHRTDPLLDLTSRADVAVFERLLTAQLDDPSRRGDG